MSYIGKCVNKTDLLMNKLKPSRNLIVFIISDNYWFVHTLERIQTILSTPYQLGNWLLPNGMIVDSSLQSCFENKVNTMKLVKKQGTDHKVDKSFVYYNVKPLKRADIKSEEYSNI